MRHTTYVRKIKRIVDAAYARAHTPYWPLAVIAKDGRWWDCCGKPWDQKAWRELDREDAPEAGFLVIVCHEDDE